MGKSRIRVLESGGYSYHERSLVLTLRNSLTKRNSQTHSSYNYGMARNVTVRRTTSDLSLTYSTPLAMLLDRCIRSNSLNEARRVHNQIIKAPFASEVFINNRLIDAYGKCGCLEDACKVFDTMTRKNNFTYNSIITVFLRFGFLDKALRVFLSILEPDLCSWNLMVSGFAQHDRYDEAVEWFVRMHREGFVVNQYSFGSVLSACSGLDDMRLGMQVHGLLTKYPCSNDVYMGSALVDVYAKCGNVDGARRAFDGMEKRNTITWNTLITCYEQNGSPGEAIEIFVKMMEYLIEPDEVTLSSVASACATLRAIREGMQIHTWALKTDAFRDDLILCNALVDMYAKCGRVNLARWIFDRMPIRNVVSETSMVSGYAKAASVKDAEALFFSMEYKNVVAWNALIAGYVANGESEEAVNLFCLLKRHSIWPTHFTFANLLNACSNLPDLKIGRQVHVHVLKHGFRFQIGPESDLFVGNALIDMYMKCGSVEDGQWAFYNMSGRDKISWNATIVGLAQNGYGVEALEKFQKMLESGEKPDHITMIGVLCACSHAGLVEEGRQHFNSMIGQYGLVPLKDHYACMVDLFGRAGCLHEAKSLIETMPIQPDCIMLASLLAACRVHHDILMANYAADRLLELDPTSSGPYVLISNLYAELGRWKEVVGVRKLMKERGVVKQPACSWVEVQNDVHVFMVKDRSHPQSEEIYQLLLLLTRQMKLVGRVPYNDNYDEKRRDVLSTLSCPPNSLVLFG